MTDVAIREIDVADVNGVIFTAGDTAEAALWKDGQWQETHPILISKIFVECDNEDDMVIEHKRIKPCRAMGGDEALPEVNDAFVVSDVPGHGWTLTPMRQDDYDKALEERQAWYANTFEKEWHERPHTLKV